MCQHEEYLNTADVAKMIGKTAATARMWMYRYGTADIDVCPYCGQAVRTTLVGKEGFIGFLKGTGRYNGVVQDSPERKDAP